MIAEFSLHSCVKKKSDSLIYETVIDKEKSIKDLVSIMFEK